VSSNQHIPGLLILAAISRLRDAHARIVISDLGNRTCLEITSTGVYSWTNWNVMWNTPFEVGISRGVTGLWRPGITPEELAAICAMASKYRYRE